MNLIVKHILNIIRPGALLVALFVWPLTPADAQSQCLKVTITPGNDQLTEVDGDGIYFDCTPSGGSGNYTFQWTFNGVEDPPSATQKTPGNLTFGKAGSVNTISVIVTDTSNNQTATAQVKVGVPLIQFSSEDTNPDTYFKQNDIWFFQNGNGDTNYPEYLGLSITGTDGLTYTVKIVGENNVATLSNSSASEQETGDDTDDNIKAVGWCSNENDLHVTVTFNGTVVGDTAVDNESPNDYFTARAPVNCTVSSGFPSTTRLTSQGYPGWRTVFNYGVTDKFNHIMNNVWVTENYNPASPWNNLGSCNWSTQIAYHADYTSAAGTFGDIYQAVVGGGTLTPTTVYPGSSGQSIPCISSNQSYLIGGETPSSPNSGVGGTGFVVYTDQTTFCRGYAHQ